MGGLKNVVTIQNGKNEAAILCALEDRAKSLIEDCLHDCVCISPVAIQELDVVELDTPGEVILLQAIHLL